MILAFILLFQVISGGGTVTHGAQVTSYSQAPPVLSLQGGCQNGQVGVAYSCVVYATGGVAPYTYTPTGALPPGLTMTGNNISGAPTTAGTTQFGVALTDSGTPQGSGTSTISITITAAPPPQGLQLNTVCPTGVVGTPYICTMSAINGTPPYSYTELTRRAAHELVRSIPWEPRVPPGLSFSGNTISGTPTQAGTGQYTFQVTDSASPPATATGIVIITITASGGTAELPQEWANPHEADLPSSGVTTQYIHTDGSGNYPCSLAGLNSMMTAWSNSPPNAWFHVIIDDGLSTATGGRCMINTGAGWTWLAKTTGAPTGFLVIESAHPNTRMQTVCNHLAGVQLTGPSPRNPGCNTTFNDQQHTYALYSPNTNAYGAVINTGSAAATYPLSNIVIRDAEIYPTTGANVSGSQPVNMGGGGGVISMMPTKLGFEYDYFHGDTNDVGAGQTPISNFIYVVCHLCWFDWNYFDQISRNRGPGGSGSSMGEGHVFSSTNMYGVKIAHNFIEGGEIGSMSGGAIPAAKIPAADIEVRANYWTRNPAWMILAPSTGQALWQRCPVTGIKNPYEIKEMTRVLLNGNVFENMLPCGQSGQGITINVRAFASNNDSAAITDVTFTNNVTRHTIEGTQTAARSGGNQNGSYQSQPGRRWNFINNLYYDISPAPQGAIGTVYSGANVWQWGSAIATAFNCNATRDAAGAITTLDSCTAVTSIPCTANCGGIGTQPGNFRTLQAVGDPTVVVNCVDTSFNTPQGTTPPTSGLGPPSLQGTNGVDLTEPPPSQTVVYANPGTPNATTSGCQLRNAQGWPSESILSHNTYVFNSRPNVYYNNAGQGQPQCVRTRGTTIENEIYVPLSGTVPYYAGASNVCGTQANNAGIRAGFDVNTLSFDYLLLPGATIANFATYPPSTGITGGTAGSHLWAVGLGAQSCAGATADVSCTGLSGGMNGNTILVYPGDTVDPLVYYSLVPTSVYKAGGARQASDGSDMGADMNKIRNAGNETIFSGCSPGACGPTGPFPD